MKINLSFQDPSKRTLNIINLFNLQNDKNCSISLIIKWNEIELYNRDNPKQNPIKVNFTSKKNNYRCYYITKKELLAKAIGLKNCYFPFVLDLTAGLGIDSFILSFLGCHVIMVERNPIIAALLNDGLYRGYQDKTIGNWLKKRLHLIFDDSFRFLSKLTFKPDIIYLDPMYPINKKNSLPKKNMQIFRKLIGKDHDSQNLLNISRKIAKKRIIVKRPRFAHPLSKGNINFTITGKKHRFDIYYPY